LLILLCWYGVIYEKPKIVSFGTVAPDPWIRPVHPSPFEGASNISDIALPVNTGDFKYERYVNCLG